jgi:dTDP-4-dehydrorhamnose reductase
MRKLGSEKESINVVFDQVGTPTYAKDLAKTIKAIVPHLKEGREIYHFTNEGVCSWYDFSKAIMELSGLKCKVNPIESKYFPTKAKRPSYSVLNKAKVKKDFGIEISHWRESLIECIKEIGDQL